MFNVQRKQIHDIFAGSAMIHALLFYGTLVLPATEDDRNQDPRWTTKKNNDFFVRIS